jgi:hypothetical protein
VDEETKSTIHLIARWLVESVAASELDSLMDHIANDRVESERKFKVADELRVALGYPDFAST